MIRTLVLTKEGELLQQIPVDRLGSYDVEWFWVDFHMPSEEEAQLLKSFFNFHPLAIEDCMHFLQRPKLDVYEGYLFFVLHALNQKNLAPEELDLFVGENYLVSFHFTELREVDMVWNRMLVDENIRLNPPVHLAYLLMDQLVDEYFPAAYQLEDHLNELDDNPKNLNHRSVIEEVFNIRADLLKLRRTISSMRDLLYRLLSTERTDTLKKYRHYFSDIYDHLLRLYEMVESSREVTSDMRDSYMSLNANRMSNIMTTLTVITSIFIPLTFVAGVYGMNFVYMPELEWKYGYYVVLGIMVSVGIGMLLWFRSKGWLRH